MTRLEIVIDELVLAGFDPRERHRFADALERELAAAAAPAASALARADRRSWPALPTLDARPVSPGPTRGAVADTAAVARSVGGAIAGALGQAGRSGGPVGREV